MVHAGSQTKDRWVFTLVSLFLVVEIIALLGMLRVMPLPFWEMKHRAGGDLIGSVSEKKDDVKSRSSHSLSWYPMRNGDVLYSDDSVMTGTGSSAMVTLQQTGEIEIGANSLVIFSKRKASDRQITWDLHVEKGVYRIEAKKAAVRLAIGGQLVSLKKASILTVRKEPLAQPIRMKVDRGEVSLTPSIPAHPGEQNLAVTLKSGEAIKIQMPKLTMSDSTDEKIHSSEKIHSPIPDTNKPMITRLPSLLSIQALAPKPGERRVAGFDSEKITFQWTGAQGEELELSTQNTFERSHKLPSLPFTAESQLEPGRYFWRVASNEGTSNILSFILMPRIEFLPLNPTPDTLIKDRMSIEFRWTAIPDAATYDIRVGNNELIFPTVCEGETANPTFQCQLPGPGTYFWRFQPWHKNLGEWPSSPVYRFRTKKSLAPPVPLPNKSKAPDSTFQMSPDHMSPDEMIPDTLTKRLLVMVLDYLVPTAWATEGGDWVEVEWKHTEGAIGYQVEFSLDPLFLSVLDVRETRQARASIRIKTGQLLYWRVAGRDADGDLGFFSAPQPIKEPSELPHSLPLEKKTAEKAPVNTKEETPRLVIEKPKPVIAPTEKPITDRKQPRDVYIDRTFWWRIGNLAAFRLQSTHGSGLSVSEQGISAPQWEGTVHFGGHNYEVCLDGGLSSLKLTSQDGLPSDIQSPEFSTMNWFVDGLVACDCGLGLPLVFGPYFQSIHYFGRTGIETVQLYRTFWASAMIGAYYRTTMGKAYWKNLFFIELAPIGQARGAGLGLKTGFGIRRIVWGLTAEIQFQARYQYQDIAINGTSGTRVSFFTVGMGFHAGWN